MAQAQREKDGISMADLSDKDIQEFKDKYKKKLDQQLDKKTGKSVPFLSQVQPVASREYTQFKRDYLPKHLSLYERACQISEKILSIKPDKKKIPEIQEYIDITHLNVTPAGTASLAFVLPVLIIFASLLFGIVFPFAMGYGGSLFFAGGGALIGLILIIPLQNAPKILANQWRMKASNQMVLSVFYIVTYMRHTSNLEKAINFAAEHLLPPLSLDLKKIIWNVETEKFASLKESLDDYLETWKKWNMEFIEAMHLIESSLYENTEDRRLNALDKSLSVMLEETYEKMLHYAHSLQSPLTMLHMLGIVLPILGLVILPLVVSFLPEVEWYHLLALYNIALPIGVFYLARIILSTRPTGYGQADIENNPEIKKYKNAIVKVAGKEMLVKPLFIAWVIFIVLVFIGLLPWLMQFIAPGFDVGWGPDGMVLVHDYEAENVNFYFLGYYGKEEGHLLAKGPFGLGAALMSLFITLAFGLSLGVYYRLRSKNVIKIRNQSKKLEEEFANAIFQLGNRLGDGLPPEIAFSKVSEIMQGTMSGRFFELVTQNMKNGMGLESAIFDNKHGALVYFPSNLIESAMKVLLESSRKGPLVASQALINVSQYIKEMHRVDERLKDLMADIISSMKSQVAFLTPAIAGIVIGITSMISTILGSLSTQIERIGASQVGAAGSAGNLANVLPGLFGTGIPTYYFQFIVGLYVVQIIYILSVLVNGIQNGADSLNERFMLGNNMIRSTLLYTFIAFVIMLIFNVIASQIIGSVNLSAI